MLGVEADRVQLVWASAAEGQRLAEAIEKLVSDVRRLGPLQWPADAKAVNQATPLVAS
jgi:F420-non-reducing hydrogenase iron-sulfur subunit